MRCTHRHRDRLAAPHRAGVRRRGAQQLRRHRDHRRRRCLPAVAVAHAHRRRVDASVRITRRRTAARLVGDVVDAVARPIEGISQGIGGHIRSRHCDRDRLAAAHWAGVGHSCDLWVDVGNCHRRRRRAGQVAAVGGAHADDVDAFIAPTRRCGGAGGVVELTVVVQIPVIGDDRPAVRIAGAGGEIHRLSFLAGVRPASIGDGRQVAHSDSRRVRNVVGSRRPHCVGEDARRQPRGEEAAAVDDAAAVRRPGEWCIGDYVAVGVKDCGRELLGSAWV